MQYGELLEFALELLEAAGLDEWSRQTVAESLCTASLCGNETHGVRLLAGYCASSRDGFMNGSPSYTITQPYPASAVIDADRGFGLAAGCRAIDIGVQLAEKFGVATVAVINSRHAGPMSAYTTRAAERGCMAMAMTNTPPAMRMLNGVRPFFGTNPIAFAAPRPHSQGPFSLDMATTAMANGKLGLLASAGKPIPGGVMHKEDGSTPLTEPHDFMTNGPALVESVGIEPAGPIAAHKGFGLAAMVEILCAVLPGQKLTRENVGDSLVKPSHLPGEAAHDKEPDTPVGAPRQRDGAEWGQWFLVLKVDSVISQAAFVEGMGALR